MLTPQQLGSFAHLSFNSGMVKRQASAQAALCYMVTQLDPPSQKGHSPQFSAHVYCGQTVAHLSYCRTLVKTFLLSPRELPYAKRGLGSRNSELSVCLSVRL